LISTYDVIAFKVKAGRYFLRTSNNVDYLQSLRITVCMGWRPNFDSLATGPKLIKGQ
jgi:hypothetical protein